MTLKKKDEENQPPKDGWLNPREDHPNPAMIRIARGSQGISQNDLGKKLGISQGKISKWEDGLLTPTEEEVQALAGVLHYHADVFYMSDKMHGFGSCCLYHRKKQSLPVKTLNMIHDRINMLRVGISRLLSSIEQIDISIHRMDVDEYDSPEQIARLTRATWKMPFGPVDDLVGIVEAAGGIVLMCPFGTDKLDAVSQWPPGMPPLFFINDGAPADRWRWSLAHELAHIIMHHIPTPDAEAEADRFASEFLMPERDIRPDLHMLTVQKACRLKPRWRVSIQAMIRKAKDIGVIDQKKYRSLYTYLSKLGYRKNEPNPLKQEQPTTLRRLMEMHFTDLGYSQEELARLVFCSNQSHMYRRYLNIEDRRQRFGIVG